MDRNILCRIIFSRVSLSRYEIVEFARIIGSIVRETLIAKLRIN